MRVSISFVLLTLAVLASSEVKARPAHEVARRDLGNLQEPHLMTRCDKGQSTTTSCGGSAYSGSSDSKVASMSDSASTTSASTSASTHDSKVASVSDSASTTSASTSDSTHDSKVDTSNGANKDTSLVSGDKNQAATTAQNNQAAGTTKPDQPNKAEGTDTTANTGAAGDANKDTSLVSGDKDQAATTAQNNQAAGTTKPDQPNKVEGTDTTTNTGATGQPLDSQNSQSPSAMHTTPTQSVDSSATVQPGGTTNSATVQPGGTAKSYQGLVDSCQQLVPRFVKFNEIVSRPNVDQSSAVQEFSSIVGQFENIVQTYSSCGGGCAQSQDLSGFQSVIDQLIRQFASWITAFGRWSTWTTVLQPQWQQFCNSFQGFVRLSRTIGINTSQVFQTYNLTPGTLQTYQINAAGFF